MKKVFFVTLFYLFTYAVKAQVEITVNPFPLLWGYVEAGVDLNLKTDWSIGADFFAGEDVGLGWATCKYFFNPNRGCDKFNIGAFVGAGAGGSGDVGGGIGFLLGYKAVSPKNVIFDMGLGLGRGFGGDIYVFPYYKLNFGYRFTLKK
ncbi:MAG: hypothetical protein GC192_21855 [Bacteroidetes bacterium]|nr:hypothetical protein [Bacteroidota bacterium]